MSDPLNRGEDYSMLDEFGRVNPDMERPAVTGFRAHGERVLRRWLSGLGYVWYAADYGGNVLDLLNAVCTIALRTNKSQELRQQAMAEAGTISARVSIKQVDDTVTVESTIDVEGFSYSLKVNLNSSAISASILGV